ncbi:MAG: hypothetical protein WCN86_01785 [bacterium]
MNRAVKAILAVAIALVYTIMIGMLAFLIFPEAKSKTTDDSYKTAQNDYQICANPTSYSGDFLSPDVSLCEQQLHDTRRQEAERTASSTEIINTNRLKLSLGFVILGFIVGFMSVGFAPLAVGMSGGATIIMMLSLSILGSTSIVDTITTLLYLACFILLVVMLFVIDKILPAPLVLEPVEPHNKPAPDLKPEPVVDATALAPNGNIPPKE